MSHILVVFYIITFAVGFASIIITLLIYRRMNNRLILEYAVFQILFTFYIVLTLYTSYTSLFFGISNIYFNLFALILFFLWFSISFYYFPYVIYKILEISYSKIKFVFLALSLLIILQIIPFFILHKDWEKIETILFFESDVVCYSMFFCLLIYLLIIAAKYKNKIENYIKKRFVNSLFYLNLIFIPFFIIDFFYRKTELEWKMLPYCFKFAALYYLIWNVVNIKFSFDFFGDASKDLEKKALAFFQNFDLSDKEKEIVLMLAKGMETKEISELIFTSQGTIRNYIYNICNKTHSKNRQELLHRIYNL